VCVVPEEIHVMRGCAGIGRILVAVAVAGGLAGEAARAQMRPERTEGPKTAGTSGAVPLKIRTMPKAGKAVMVRTPEYSVSGSRSARKPREWAVFDVIYDTRPEWIGEIACSYTVLAEGRNEEGKRAYSLYQTTVRYADVGRGEHTACVVLPPQAVERFGEPIAFYVEFSVEGKVVASDSVVGISNLPADWWKNERVVGSSSVARRDGYLVDRSKTPFALINPDEYEAVK
jgi:hypothetical protein